MNFFLFGSPRSREAGSLSSGDPRPVTVEKNRYAMGEFWGERLFRLLSQLKHISRFMPFSLRKGFSSLALLFLGAGAFPALPIIDTKELATPDPSETAVAIDPVELCRWQKDFTFFQELVVGAEKKEIEDCHLAVPEVSATQEAPATPKDGALETTIASMASGYPLEAMAPTIAEYDREVAALIVGIAKKESNWGKRVPVDTAGADCFNYWGFKGAGTRGVAMGHGCFGSPEEAVHAVGNRIAELVTLRKTSEPKNMIIWKCGSSCATHSPESVRKWIADVDLYYRQIVGTN